MGLCARNQLEGGWQLTIATAQPAALTAKVPSSQCLAEESDIPAVLLRDPCHLEIIIPARNEALRLPSTLTRTIQYLEKQHIHHP